MRIVYVRALGAGSARARPAAASAALRPLVVSARICCARAISPQRTQASTYAFTAGVSAPPQAVSASSALKAECALAKSPARPQLEIMIV